MKKTDLIEELAQAADISKAQAGRMLVHLTEIAYREAREGFTIPGICKLKVVKKKASRYRNPATGKLMMLAERDILKATPLKKAKETVTPRPADFATMIPEKDKAPETAPSKVRHPDIIDEPKPGVMGDGDMGSIVFSCGDCGSMLSATLEQAGTETVCPICGIQALVPNRNDSADTGESAGGLNTRTQDAPAPLSALQDFVTFICQACGQEIEAPIDMAAMDAACPTCGSRIHIPDESPDEVVVTPPEEKEKSDMTQPDKKSMTIRIDLSDLE